MEPSNRFDLGVLVRGCVRCGAQLVPAGRVRYGDELPLMLSAQMPLTLHGNEFLKVKCPTGCVGQNLIFARSADGTPYFFSEPYEHGDRRPARSGTEAPMHTRRIELEYNDAGLITSMTEKRSGAPIAEKSLLAEPWFPSHVTGATDRAHRPPSVSTSRTTKPKD